MSVDTVTADTEDSPVPGKLRSLVGAITEAAEYARDAWERSEGSFEKKRDGSRVTAVDRALDRFLRRELEALGAERVRSEEHRQEGPRGEMREGWIVDPIDGTHPFTEGRDGFAVQAAHISAGRTDRAIMALPARRELYLAAGGQGAWRMAEGGSEATPLELSGGADPVAREAGGTVTDLDGRTLRYGAPDPVQPGGVVATGPGVVHERAREILAGASLGASG